MRQLIDSPNAATWIAEEEGRMAGFAIVEWTEFAKGILAYIQTLEVLPERRGGGIGGQLLDRIEGSARAVNAVAIWLHVDEKNALALRLYAANDYLYASRKENYYAEGRAALIFSKPLDPKTDRQEIQ